MDYTTPGRIEQAFPVENLVFLNTRRRQVTNPHFKWGFTIGRSAALYWFRLRRGSQHTMCWRPLLAALYSILKFIVLFLFSDIIPDCLFVYIPYRRNIVASCPEMPV